MITANLEITADSKQISFGRTLINWNRQEIMFQYAEGKIYTHRMTEAQWNYLVSGLQSLMGQIPKISNLNISEYNPNLWDEDEE